jgi:hypothetical protein
MARISGGLRRVACWVRDVARDFVSWAFGYEGAAPYRRAVSPGEATDGWTHPDGDTPTSSAGRREPPGPADRPGSPRS